MNVQLLLTRMLKFTRWYSRGWIHSILIVKGDENHMILETWHWKKRWERDYLSTPQKGQFRGMDTYLAHRISQQESILWQTFHKKVITLWGKSNFHKVDQGKESRETVVYCTRFVLVILSFPGNNLSFNFDRCPTWQFWTYK